MATDRDNQRSRRGPPPEKPWNDNNSNQRGSHEGKREITSDKRDGPTQHTKTEPSISYNEALPK